MDRGDELLVQTLREAVGESLRSVFVQKSGGLVPLYVRDDIYEDIDHDSLQSDIQTLRRVAHAEDNLHCLNTIGEYRSTVSLFDDRVIMRIVDGTDHALALSLDRTAASRLDEFVSECRSAFQRYD